MQTRHVNGYRQNAHDGAHACPLPGEAAVLDRLADFALSEGRATLAERLSHAAAELREGAQ